MITCDIISAGISAKCICGKHMDGGVHFLKVDGVPENLLCSEHCPCCNPKLEPWQGAAETISGDQGVLWSN